MDVKNNKYHCHDEVSFEKRGLFSRSLIKGIIISSRFVNYSWVYLVECNHDKKLMTVLENDLWLLKSSQEEQ